MIIQLSLVVATVPLQYHTVVETTTTLHHRHYTATTVATLTCHPPPRLWANDARLARFDPKCWAEHLPHAVEAFFYYSADASYAASAPADFAKAFPEAETAPLLELDLRNYDAPFSVARAHGRRTSSETEPAPRRAQSE